MKFILGKKVNMTQIWQGDRVVPCTVVQAGPCFVTQVKDNKKDSYSAVQISYGERKSKNIAKSVRGHLKKALGREDVRYLREFRLKTVDPSIEVGKMIDVSTFSEGDIVDVVSTSKGKGFQGVVKKFGFAGSQKTHGNKDQLRASGSVGAKGPARVFKGKKMAGRMGGDKTTLKNLEIVQVDLDNNLLFIKGGISGARNSLVMIKSDGELKLKDFKLEDLQNDKEDKKTETDKAEEVKNEEVVSEAVSEVAENKKDADSESNQAEESDRDNASAQETNSANNNAQEKEESGENKEEVPNQEAEKEEVSADDSAQNK